MKINRMLFILCYMLILFSSSLYAVDIVLQNGTGGYSGCDDAFIKNGTADVPTVNNNYGHLKQLNCEYEHRM